MAVFICVSVFESTAANKTRAESVEIAEPSTEFSCDISTRKFGN